MHEGRYSWREVCKDCDEYVCLPNIYLSVCLSGCQCISETTLPNVSDRQRASHILCTLIVAVARSSFDGVAIRHVLPVHVDDGRVFTQWAGSYGASCVPVSVTTAQNPNRFCSTTMIGVWTISLKIYTTTVVADLIIRWFHPSDYLLTVSSRAYPVASPSIYYRTLLAYFSSYSNYLSLCYTIQNIVYNCCQIADMTLLKAYSLRPRRHDLI